MSLSLGTGIMIKSVYNQEFLKLMEKKVIIYIYLILYNMTKSFVKQSMNEMINEIDLKDVSKVIIKKNRHS